MVSKSDLQTTDQSSRGEPSLAHGACLRKTHNSIYLLLLLFVEVCSSCGGIVSSPPPAASVSVVPDSAQPFAGASVKFTAVVRNSANSNVTWQVNLVPGGNATLGTIDASGFYTAPISVPSSPTVTVRAVLQSDPATSGSSSVTIQQVNSISVSPGISSLTTSQTLQLQVSTPGVSNSEITWAVDGVPSTSTNTTNGTISPTGVYTPPSSVGFHLITATLISNPSAIGSAKVYVTDFPGTLTWRNDNARSGMNSRELALAPGTVNVSKFGKLFSCPLDGYAYAQPLYVPNLAIPGKGTRNVIFVATEKDSVFAFDADVSPCVQLWQASLIPPGSQALPAPTLEFNSDDIVPFVGITGTPVISLSSSYLYVVAKTTNTAATPAVYSQNLYALDLATGQPRILQTGAPITIPGTPVSPFSALLENQRAALLLENGIVYVAFGSHRAKDSDQGIGDYHGWLFAYDASNLLQTAAFNVTPPNGIQGGIWQSGGGPAADSNHNVFVITGDGAFSEDRGGTEYSNSFLRFGTAGTLSLMDFFSPCDAKTLGLMDFGASAPLLLPDFAGSSSMPHLMVSASKNGSLYVVNRDNLGGYISGCPDSSLRVQTVRAALGTNPILSTPLFWGDAIYVAAGNEKLRSFPMLGGILASSLSSSQSPETLGPMGATPVASSYDPNNSYKASDTIIWLIDSSGAHALPAPSSPAILRAFDPNNFLNEIYNTGMAGSRDAAGAAVKFTVPTVANGKVYVGTQTELDVYGLFP